MLGIKSTNYNYVVRLQYQCVFLVCILSTFHSNGLVLLFLPADLIMLGKFSNINHTSAVVLYLQLFQNVKMSNALFL